jgi:hypothetical protein
MRVGLGGIELDPISMTYLISSRNLGHQMNILWLLFK